MSDVLAINFLTYAERLTICEWLQIVECARVLRTQRLPAVRRLRDTIALDVPTSCRDRDPFDAAVMRSHEMVPLQEFGDGTDGRHTIARDCRGARYCTSFAGLQIRCATRAPRNNASTSSEMRWGHACGA
jgi:hypothetical protein